MDDVGHGRADQRGARHRQHRHPGEVLDLGDGGAHDVHDRNGLAPRPAGRRAREDDEAFGVAAHAGRQVVEAEQVLQRLRVLRPALHGVEQRELAVQQALVAAGQVEEHVADAAAQGRLPDGRLDGGPLDGAERRTDVLDLRRPAGVDGRRLVLDVDVLALLEAVDDVGQPLVGQLERGVPQAGEVGDEAAAEPQREDDRGHDGDQTHATRDGDPPEDPGGQFGRVGVQRLGGGHARPVELADQAVGGGLPALHVGRQRAAQPLLRQDHVFDVGETLVQVGGEHPLVRAAHVGRQRRQVLGVVELAQGDELGERLVRLGRHLVLRQRALDQGVFTGQHLVRRSHGHQGAGLLEQTGLLALDTRVFGSKSACDPPVIGPSSSSRSSLTRSRPLAHRQSPRIEIASGRAQRLSPAPLGRFFGPPPRGERIAAIINGMAARRSESLVPVHPVAPAQPISWLPSMRCATPRVQLAAEKRCDGEMDWY